MVTRNEAIERIEEIAQAMRQNLTVVLPSAFLIAIGVGITAIPGIEFFLQRYADPFLSTYNISPALIFFMRTAFYWGSFTLLGRVFHRYQAILHPAIKKAWGFNAFFPLIPVATGGMLALCGYKDLAMPVVLILVGCFFCLIGRFTHVAITVLALSYVIVGIGSIYLSTLNIPCLYMFLLAFQGCACVLTGLVMRFFSNE